MQHNESNIKVYFTRDYSIFKSLSGNRDLNQRKINSMIKDIEDDLDMLKYYPILVDEKMQVVDGQHRLYVARKMNSNIWYIIVKVDLELTDIAKLNSNTDKWKTSDFLNCYIVKGLESYKTLGEFTKKWNIPVGVAAKILMYGTPLTTSESKGVKLPFERGQFEVNYLTYANLLMEVVALFAEHKSHRSRTFITAIHNILKAEKADILLLAAQYKANPEPLEKCDSTKDYMAGLELVYNYRKQHRQAIY